MLRRLGRQDQPRHGQELYPRGQLWRLRWQARFRAPLCLQRRPGVDSRQSLPAQRLVRRAQRRGLLWRLRVRGRLHAPQCPQPRPGLDSRQSLLARFRRLLWRLLEPAWFHALCLQRRPGVDSPQALQARRLGLLVWRLDRRAWRLGLPLLRALCRRFQLCLWVVEAPGYGLCK
jgi:hypothetical protein